jgi:predicted Fe-Mo cluster-binding NifX family protein
MVAEKRKRDSYESDVVTFLRRGELSIVAAIATKLPDVFTGEILNKLDLTDTLSLAQVSKSYRDAVWSAGGVGCMRAKIRTHLDTLNDPETTDNPVYWAARHDNLPAIKALAESGVDIIKSVSTKNGNYKGKGTPLHTAAYRDGTAVLKWLIDAGIDVNNQSSMGSTALQMATEKGHTHIVMDLIKAGADVNLAGEKGVTPLHQAAHKGHDGIIVALITAGADINKVTKKGCTALGIAEQHNHEKIVKLLKHFGARSQTGHPAVVT